MKKPKLFIAIIIVLVLGLVTIPAYAQSDDTVTVQVDRYQLSTDEVLTLTLSVDEAAGNAGQPVLPAMSDFTVIGSSKASQISIINGDMKMEAVYTYQLRPSQAGSLVIDTITVDVNGRTYGTAPLTIEVTQGTGQLQPPPSAGGAMGQFPSFPNMPNLPNMGGLANPTQPSQQMDPADAATELTGQDYFVEAVVDNQIPYQGEQVIYTFRFYQGR